jgi:hypothetical protein
VWSWFWREKVGVGLFCETDNFDQKKDLAWVLGWFERQTRDLRLSNEGLYIKGDIVDLGVSFSEEMK